jgi:segregation and condensation protein A
MEMDIAGNQVEGYRVLTPVYEGPLDLLLRLIEDAQLDITTLALAQVTDQYLSYLANLENHDADEVSAFLVIASRLILIKSNSLLPRPPVISHEEMLDSEALAQQLIRYRRFKQIAAWFQHREDADLHSYLRVAPLPIKVDAKLDLAGITIKDLGEAAWAIFQGKSNLVDLSSVISLPRITLRQKIQMIIHKLKISRSLSFSAILDSGSRQEVVVTFLALLELIKRQFIKVQQQSLFGDIELQSIGELDHAAEGDLEFQD